MAISNIASTANITATPDAQTSSSSGEIAGNFQQFLMLLTTQLKNQSPLDPLDTNQFTQQLVQFASVEQQLKTNATLSALVASSKASTASTAAGLVGSAVTIDGSSSEFTGGSASWTLTAEKASNATIQILDSTGAVVATQNKSLTPGAQNFVWDGRTSNGDTATTGTFKVQVTARDASGQNAKVGTDVHGTVVSVELSGEAAEIVVAGRRVPLSALKSIGG